MNVNNAKGIVGRIAFCLARFTFGLFPGGRIVALGTGRNKIGAIMVVNLDRQPQRWRQVIRELGRFRTNEGKSLVSITRRFTAVDARDGLAVAATADVDRTYHIGDQLFVQPDNRLEDCFSADETVRMTPQEVAVARSHIEVWKIIVTGQHDYVLVLEDDVWFRRGAATAIDDGWRAALSRYRDQEGPQLLYLSYLDAGGTAERVEVCQSLFRPVRGLWFLSGYVLSREGAALLLRAMPVVGPVDTWMNYRFKELRTLALTTPAILQREDTPSSNSYSVLPYLARAGIVDAGSGGLPSNQVSVRSVFAWTTQAECESLPMALSMLGLRVRVFDGDEDEISVNELSEITEEYDALVDPPLAPDAFLAAMKTGDSRFIFETNAVLAKLNLEIVPPSQTTILAQTECPDRPWEPLCTFLGLTKPIYSFPIGASRRLRLFRDLRQQVGVSSDRVLHRDCKLDDTPWVLSPRSNWLARPPKGLNVQKFATRLVHAEMTVSNPEFVELAETFPGNLASFAPRCVRYDKSGAQLTLNRDAAGNRLFQSGAIASARSFQYGRFEAHIKAASGAGLITGFFLYRAAPRQEIDIELPGNDPRHMLVNVYFNPGDDETAMDFGYRGTPVRIDLGFDTTKEHHHYVIEWEPGRIIWSVDGRIVHDRVGWDPTPIPHLPMRLHANLWASRSEELAGQIVDHNLPATGTIKNISVWAEPEV